LSGRSHEHLFERGSARFLENLDRYHRGEAMISVVNYELGY